MLNRQTIASIQSGTDTEVYCEVTNLALFIATGGFLEQANRLLSELWKYKLPHDRNTWLPDIAFTVLWNAAGAHPEFIPFIPEDIDSIEKNMRGYIAMDKWSYEMPNKPWNELTGQDLLRMALITAALVKGADRLPPDIRTTNLPLEGIPGGLSAELMNKITQALDAHSIQASDQFPSPAKELEALAMIEKLSSEGITYSEEFALGAELAAKHNKRDTAIHLAKLWANGYHDASIRVNFSLLAAGRHIAPLLLQKIIAEELQLSVSVVESFLAEAIATLDRRLQQGRSLAYGELSWKELLNKISKASLESEDPPYEEAIIQSGWIGFDGATDVEIAMAEQRLGVIFPSDYKQFLQITNGFPALRTTTPSLLPVNKIDFIRNILDEDTFDGILNWPWNDEEAEAIKESLLKGIMISDYPDEQMLWLLPSPDENANSWELWFFAYWMPGERRFPGFRFYMEKQLDQI